MLCIFKVKTRYKSVAIQAKRSQSALEFMMTYGWVILIIIIVLATLYATGVFNIASSTPNVCNLSTGIGCATISFTPTGTLTVSLQQSTQDTINVVSLGCNDQGIAADMVPALPPASISIGGNSTFSVECYRTVSGSLIPFNGQPGQAFKGYLVVNYTDLATGFTQTTTGAITQKVTTPQPQSPLGFGALEYVPITITNTNTIAATGSNFQQMISIPASTYSSYEAADLGNVRFSLGSSELSSWCESGCSSGAGSAVFWVVLPSGIAANSNVVAQLMFLSTSTEYDGVIAGEAPQLSCNNPANTISGCAAGQYGKYDNGAAIFPTYQNFAGIFSPASWTLDNYVPPGTISVDNGVYVITNTADHGSLLYQNAAIVPTTVAFDAYTDWVSSAGGAGPSDGTEIGTFYNYEITQAGDFVNVNSILVNASDDPTGMVTYKLNQPLSQWVTETVGYLSNSQEVFQVNYGAPTYGALYNNMDTMSENIQNYYGYATVTVQWVRTRILPPGATMPTVAFGALS